MGSWRRFFEGVKLLTYAALWLVCIVLCVFVVYALAQVHWALAAIVVFVIVAWGVGGLAVL